MENDILVSFEKLAKLLNTTVSMLRIFTSHFTLYKFVRYDYIYKPKKTRTPHFLLNDNSIKALQCYLELRYWRRSWDVNKVKKHYKKSIISKGGESAKLN